MADALNLDGLEALSHPDAPPLFTTKPPEWIATYLPRYCLAASDRTVHDSRGLALIVRELHRDGLWQQMFNSWDECCQALFKRPAAWVAQVVEGVRVLHGQGHLGAIPAREALAAKAQDHAQQMLALKDPQFAEASRPTKEQVEKGDNVTLKETGKGNSAAYLAARLKKAQRDDLLEQIGPRKRFRSVRAAAIEAGIIKPVPTIRVTNDMPAVAAKLCQHLNREQRIQLIDLLAPDL
jgi:hypothetical protein